MISAISFRLTALPEFELPKNEFRPSEIPLGEMIPYSTIDKMKQTLCYIIILCQSCKLPPIHSMQNISISSYFPNLIT